MKDSDSILASYQALMQNHASQFDPAVTALKELVEERIQELRRSERTLVEAQTAELKRINDVLANDARCLLPTPEFRTFVKEYKKLPGKSYGQQPNITISEDPATWLLTTLEFPISVSDYQTLEDPDAYDDERTHILYSYSIALRMGDVEHVIYVPCRRTYNLNDHRDFSLKEQIDFYIADDVEDLLSEIKYPEAESNQLAKELSVLIAYAKNLLALKPRITNFEYTSIMPS